MHAWIVKLPVALAFVLALATANANEVLKWNEIAAKAASAGGQNPPQTTRTLAMVQAAVHDALNSIKPRYAAYHFKRSPLSGASPDAAIAAASRTVLVSEIPLFGSPPARVEALAAVDESYRASLSAIPDGPAKQAGVAIGEAAGTAVVQLRRDDGATKPAPYTPASGPGRWRPTPNPDPSNPLIKDPKAAPGSAPSTSPNWGNLPTFTRLTVTTDMLSGPPALTSAQYTRDFNEVKTLGGQVSPARTAEQAELARFWFEGPGSWYRVARVASESRGLDTWDSARVLAATSLAMADAFIAGFKIRYHYDFWRPVTAIREADTDGNDATIADPKWNSLQNTPAVSDYPSTQSLFSGAAAAVLEQLLGGDKVSLTLSSGPPFANIKRSYTSLSQAARESADSRVYAGIHFRSACEDGLTLGRRIGQHAATSTLQQLTK